MNIFLRCRFIVLFTASFILLAACQSTEQQPDLSTPTQIAEVMVEETAVSQPPTAQPSNTPFPTVPSTATPSPTTIPTVANTPSIMIPATATSTPRPTSTTAPSFPIVYAGTAVPGSSKPISEINFQQLTQVAQWGNGDILSVAFTPDEKAFVVGTVAGFYVYDGAAPYEQFRWKAWESAFYYESMFFSEDGRYLLLSNRDESRIYHFSNGQLEANAEAANIKWIKSSKQLSYNDHVAVSADGLWRFKGRLMSVEGSLSLAETILEVYDNDTGELLNTLAEETLYVEYTDRMEPSGCDLTYYGMCGNAFDPIAMSPYRVSFSPAGDTVSVLYRASSIGYSDRFSLLHVYSMDDGRVVARIGNFTQPTETFSYAPDGQSLLVAYGNGSIQIWDMNEIRPVANFWHFGSPIRDASYSFDGRYLVAQRQGWVEKWRTSNGKLQTRYQANAFALSPVANLLALGDVDGQIVVQDMNTDQPIHTIQAHTAKIYALTFSPDGDTLTSSGEDCRVQSWDVATGVYLHDFAENDTEVDEMFGWSRIFIKKMMYVTEDQLIGYGSWSRVVNWDVPSSETNYMIEPEPLEYYNGMITLNTHFPEFLEFNPENQNFVINYVEYDLDTGEQLGQYQPPDNFPKDCATIGPATADGKLMFTKGYDTREGEVCILDTTDQHLVQALEVKSKITSNYDPISWLYLSPDGSQLLISSHSGILQVYQIKE